MRERSGGNRRRRKFRQCDISAKVSLYRSAGRQCDRRWTRAECWERRAGDADFAGGGWEGSAATLVSAAGTFGATVGSDAVVGECITAAGAFEPSGRRWALSAIRPSVSTAPTTKKYFKISIVPPRAASAAASRFSRARGPWGSRAAVCRYQDGLFSRVKGGGAGRPFPTRPRRPALGLTLQNENPPGISPGGPTPITSSLPPVHPRSEARSRTTPI